MAYDKIHKAINFAIVAHAGQQRKGKDVPYIVHPLSVAVILARIGVAEEVIMAGILHDTVEDSEGGITLEDINREFGDVVEGLVRHVTELDKSLPWSERKAVALAHVYEMPHDALLMKMADFVANLADLLEDLEKSGEAVWSRFHTTKEKKLAQQRQLAVAFETVWPDNPLLPEIRLGIEKLNMAMESKETK